MEKASPLSKIYSVLKDRQENEWLTEFEKKDFEDLKDNYHVQTYDKSGRKAKIFMKSYLTFVRKFEEEKK